MNCAYHNDREVQGVCSSCGRPVCEECLVNLNGQVHCKTCVSAQMHKPRRDLNGGLRFLLSFCPGLGHMYLGLFNRGVQLLVFFFGTITLMNLLRIDTFGGLFIAGLVFFSIFDAREAHLRIQQGLEAEDRGFVDVKTWRLEFSSRYIGYGLVALGVLAMYRILMDDVLAMMFGNSAQYYHMVNVINGAVLGVLAIGGGLWLLGKNFKDS
ncbi:MAG TPA: B-box zinc finger protein [Symbiobacteriaceae bacterium]|jgi:TM2 domain-containing membrane protein YozV